MNTTISVSLPTTAATRVRRTAKRRGFPSTSEYLRYLITEGEGDLITEEELLKETREAEREYHQGKLKPYPSMEAALKAFKG